MSVLKIKPKFECRWDLVSLGEVLLRLDAGNERLHTTRQFKVFECGGEYNVARNLKKVFNLRTAIFTALAKNPIGKLLEDLILQGGVDGSQVLWREPGNPDDELRNGICFTEQGCGFRPPGAFSDRLNSAILHLQPGEIDWNWMFGEYCARWFHTSVNFASLSETAIRAAETAMRFAQSHGAIVSYDLNNEDSLFQTKIESELLDDMNSRLLPFVDVIFGVPEFDFRTANFDEHKFAVAAEKLQLNYPNIKIVCTILRDVQAANRHDLSGVCFADNQIFKAYTYPNAEVYDRAGSRDAFTSGLIYSLLNNKGEQFAIECAAAHAVLSMTTPGDNSTAMLHEIENLMDFPAVNVERF